MTQPKVSYACHLVSNIFLVSLLLVSTALRSSNNDHLGKQKSRPVGLR